MLLFLVSCLTRSWYSSEVPVGEPELSPISSPASVCTAELEGEDRGLVELSVQVERHQDFAVLQRLRADELATWDDQDYGWQWMFWSGIFGLGGAVLFLDDPDQPGYEPIAPGLGAGILCGSLCGVGIGGVMRLMDGRKAGRRKGEVRESQVDVQRKVEPSAEDAVSLSVGGVLRASAKTDASGRAQLSARVYADDPPDWTLSSASGASCSVQVAGTRSQAIELRARIASHLEAGELAAAVAELPGEGWTEASLDELWEPIGEALEVAIAREVEAGDAAEARALLELAPASRRAELRGPVDRARGQACEAASEQARAAWLKMALATNKQATAATKRLVGPSERLEEAGYTVANQIRAQVEAGLRAGICPTNPYYGITYNGRMYDESCAILTDLGELDELLGEVYRAGRHGRVSWHFARAAEACDRAEHAGGSEARCQELWGALRGMEYGIESGTGQGLVGIALYSSERVVERLDGWRPEGLKLSLGALSSAAKTLQREAEAADLVYLQVDPTWNGYRAALKGRAPTSSLETLTELRGAAGTRSLLAPTEAMAEHCGR